MSFKPLKKESQFNRWRKERGFLEEEAPIKKGSDFRSVDEAETFNVKRPSPKLEWQQAPLPKLDRILETHKKAKTEGLRALARTGTFVARRSTEFLDFMLDAILSSTASVLEKPAIVPVHPKYDKFMDGKKEEWASTLRTLTDKDKFPTVKLKEAVAQLEQIDFLRPSDEWSKATTVERFGLEHIGETLMVTGPQIVGSIGMFAINPIGGVAVLAGSTADNVKDDAIAHGWEHDDAQLLGLGTGTLVAALEKIVPSRIFKGGLKVKRQFISSFAKKIAETSLLEAGTEITQEAIEMLATKTFRDVGIDEIFDRTIMAAFGGLLGGGFMGTIANFANIQRKQGPAHIPVGLTIEDVGKAPDKKPETRFEKWQKERGVKPEVDPEVEPRVEVRPEVDPEVDPEVKPIPKELEPLAREARKFKSADEFVQNYDGGLVINKEAFNDFIAGGPGNISNLSKLLTPQGKQLVKKLELPDIPIQVQEAGEETIGHHAQIVWDEKTGLRDAFIQIEISPAEEFGVEGLGEKEFNLIHELTHARQIMLNRLRGAKVGTKETERSADKSATFHLENIKFQLADFHAQAIKEEKKEIITHKGLPVGVPSKRSVAINLPETRFQELFTSLKASKPEPVSTILNVSPSNFMNRSFIQSYISKIQEVSQRYLQPFKKYLEEATGKPVDVRVKKKDSIYGKIERYLLNDQDPTTIADNLAGRVIINSSEIPIQLQNIKRDFDVIEIQDFFKTPSEWGYRGINIKVKMPNGLLAEIQLHTPESLELANEIHPIYEKWRNKDLSKLNPSQKNKMLADLETSQQFANSYIQSTKEVKPEVEPEVEPEIEPEVKPIRKEIRKKPPTLRKLGVKPPISPFVKKREYTLLKDRIKNVARGAKEGRTTTRQEIRAVQTELLDILDASRMEAVDKAKFRRTIKNVQTQEQLQKILPAFEKKVVDLIEKREVRTLKDRIKKELRKITPKKDKPGRTTVIYEFLKRGLKQKYFDKVGVRTQAQNETLLEELQLKIETYDIADPIHREDFVLHALLSEDTKGLNEMNAGELDAVLTRIQQTRKIARDSFLWKQLERAADLREKIEGSIENMRGKGIRPQTPINKRRLRRELRRFISTIDIFDRGFLQIVNLLDSIRGGRFFRDAIYQPIMQGNKDYFVQDNNFVEADKKFFEKVFNKKGILLDKQIAKLSKQQNIGEVIDGKGTKHNLWFTNSEMIDIYLYGKTKPTIEAMKEQGIYVGGDNPKTRVFYMTDSVLAKIEGKMSREAKMIADYIMENIQDNEFVKKMTDSYEFKYNKPFPFIGETYWTMVRRYMGTKQKGSDIFNPEHNRDAILSPNSFKQRVENNNPLVVSDGWGKFIKWRRDIQKFISYDKALVDAKAVIGSPDFKSEFIEKYGYKSYKHLIDSFNVVAVGGKQYNDMLAHSANYIRQILSISFVGGRPVRSLTGQSTSFVAAVAEVPLEDFSKSLGKFIASPRMAYSKMMRSPIVALRHKRADFTKGLLESETRKFQKYGISPAKVSMFFVKVGDIVGVLGAGYAIYDYNYNQYIEGGMDKKKADKMAMRDMENFVVSTQQSALPELRNFIMQQHPIIRTTGAFQQTQSQYRAKGFEAINTWLHSENKWSKKNFGRMFKRVSTYHFILPVLFETSRGNINPVSLISKAVFSPVSGFMGYGQVVEWAVKLAIYSTLIPFLGLDEDEWKRLLPFDPTTLTGESKVIFERTLKSAKDIIKQDGDERDVRRLIESSLMLLKIPAKNIREEYIKFHEILTGEDDSFLRILETEWQAKQRIKREEKKKEEEKEERMKRLRPPRPKRPTRPLRPKRPTRPIR